MKTKDQNDEIVDNLKNTELLVNKNGVLALHCIEPMEAGEILGFLDGQIVDSDVLSGLEEPIEVNQLGDGRSLVRYIKTKFSFVEHSDEPNVAVKLNPPRICCIKDIKAGEQVFINLFNAPSASTSVSPESSGRPAPGLVV